MIAWITPKASGPRARRDSALYVRKCKRGTRDAPGLAVTISEKIMQKRGWAIGDQFQIGTDGNRLFVAKVDEHGFKAVPATGSRKGEAAKHQSKSERATIKISCPKWAMDFKPTELAMSDIVWWKQDCLSVLLFKIEQAEVTP